MDRFVCVYFFDHKTEDQMFLADELLRIGYDCKFKNHSDFKGVMIQNVDPSKIHDPERTKLISQNKNLTYADHWKGTITGQAMSFLGLEQTDQARLASAYTYCLSAAYSGLCKGVSEHEVMKVRMNLLALDSGLTVDQVFNQINNSVDIVASLPYALEGVRDFTMLDPEERPPFYYDACLQLNEGFLIKDYVNGPIRYEIGGRVSSDAVMLFINSYSKLLGVKHASGFPYRMTATGYTG